jgi:hypothetical protein
VAISPTDRIDRDIAGYKEDRPLMDHNEVPVLDALAAYHRGGHTPFTPPGHKHGRGADPRVRAILGAENGHNEPVGGLDRSHRRDRVQVT